MLGARLALVALAVVACAWFALGIEQLHEQSRANALMAQPGTPSAALTARILHLLDRAATLNPDRQIDLLRVQADLRAGKDASAVKTGEAVVRAEPQNVSAWAVLEFAAGADDPPLARLAQERVRELGPPVKTGR